MPNINDETKKRVIDAITNNYMLICLVDLIADTYEVIQRSDSPGYEMITGGIYSPSIIKEYYTSKHNFRQPFAVIKIGRKTVSYFWLISGFLRTLMSQTPKEGGSGRFRYDQEAEIWSLSRGRGIKKGAALSSGSKGSIYAF